MKLYFCIEYSALSDVLDEMSNRLSVLLTFVFVYHQFSKNHKVVVSRIDKEKIALSVAIINELKAVSTECYAIFIYISVSFNHRYNGNFVIDILL